ncbi:TRAP transporter substrate-binding protein [Uliginosibacterium sediminicola]|uniref:TRAP transporter substrate-binding protein n=1 Tax=Uliginosibacterium sediminicola TaxID=2024550 RepID=A0ABU9YUN7_9RHOO
MKFTRRQFNFAAMAAAIMAASAMNPAAAQTAEFSFRYGTAFPADHPGAVRMVEAAEAIKKESKGRIDIKVFPQSQLGSEPDMISQVRSGALQFMSTAGTNLQTMVPVAGINGVAFAFKDYNTVWAAMDGELGGYVRSQLLKANLYAFDKVLDNGYRNITTATKPINTPADLSNFKIRVPGIPLWISMFKALGAAPTSINFGELYSALQTKIVDGQENPLALIQSAKLYEVQKYVSMTGHTWDGHYIFTNAKFFQGLPKDVQEIISRNFAAAAIKERKDIADLNSHLEGELKKLGLNFNYPDKKPFVDTLRANGFYKDAKEKFGPEGWAKLEKYSGPL